MSSHQGKKIAKSLKIGRDIAIFVCLMKIQRIFKKIYFFKFKIAITRSFFKIWSSSFCKHSHFIVEKEGQNGGPPMSIFC